MIPYGRQTIEEDDIEEVVKVLRSDYLTTGPKIAEFEKLVADYVGAKYAVAISNDTAALHAACHAAGIGPGDEVITTPITFAASANCILYCGGTPVFADVDPKTYNIDPKDIERKITDKTKAIIPVHLAGQPCDMDAIHKIAREHHLIVIEDAAHALGSEYKGKRIGSMSDMTTFSFHPVKPITTGEGGMIVTNDEILYKKLVLFRSHGITRDESQMTRNEGSWFYQQIDLGYNYRMTNLQAALGVAQMEELPEFIKRKHSNYELYQKLFNGFELGKLLGFREGTYSNQWFYSLEIPMERVNGSLRDIITKLQERGVQTRAIWGLIHEQLPYQNAITYEMEKASYYSKCILNFPSSTQITEDDIVYVVEQIKDVLLGI